jgi:hypothetical protein
MGTVVIFPQLPHELRSAPLRVEDVSTVVIILPVIRIERACDAPSIAETTKSPLGRKRGKRASPS